MEADGLPEALGPGAADVAEIVPELMQRLPGLEPPPELEPAQARFRLPDSIATFLKRASQASPLVLVLDDLHWADRASLLLLNHLARELGDGALLTVGTYREVRKQYSVLVQQNGTILGAALTSVDWILGLLSATMGNLEQGSAHFDDALDFCRQAG